MDHVHSGYGTDTVQFDVVLHAGDRRLLLLLDKLKALEKILSTHRFFCGNEEVKEATVCWQRLR